MAFEMFIKHVQTFSTFNFSRVFSPFIYRLLVTQDFITLNGNKNMKQITSTMMRQENEFLFYDDVESHFQRAKSEKVPRHVNTFVLLVQLKICIRNSFRFQGLVSFQCENKIII